MRVIRLSHALALVAALFAIAASARADIGNETIATASPLDWSSASSNSASASGDITPYDVDFYQFQVYQGGTVDFEMPLGTGSSALQSPRIDLFDWPDPSDPSGRWITGVAGQSLDVSLDPGVYYPRVSSGSNGLGLYVLTVNGANSGSSTTAQIGAVADPDPAPEPSVQIAFCIGSILLGAGFLRARLRVCGEKSSQD